VLRSLAVERPDELFFLARGDGTDPSTSANYRLLELRQSLALALSGVAIGIAGAASATPAIASYLYGVTPTDPLTLAGVGLALIVISPAAGYFPARRAGRVDPLRATRTE
jgi:ABC-type antimicrobial peptide transport system permease subunit